MQRRKRSWFDVHSQSGSSLVEVILAAAILATGAISMMQLFSLSVTTNVAAKSATVSTILAWQKLEQLEALPWTLVASPSRTLARNTSGFVDHLDASGVVVGVSELSPPQAVYTRRWSVEPVLVSTIEVFVLQVRVLVRGHAPDIEHEDGFIQQAQIATVVKARVQ